MQKPKNTIHNYYKSDAASRKNQLQAPSEINIYKNALKRKYSNHMEQMHENETISLVPLRGDDEKDETIKRQNLEIKQLQEQCRKFESTQSRTLSILHQYRSKLLRMENSRERKEKLSDIAPLNVLSEDKITEDQKVEFFSDQELVQLNSIKKHKSNDRAYGRKVFEYLYRDNLSELNQRTLSASSKMGKQPITPKKRDLLIKMMTVRGKNSANDEIEQLERTKPTYIRSIISDALGAVKKKYAFTPNDSQIRIGNTIKEETADLTNEINQRTMMQ